MSESEIDLQLLLSNLIINIQERENTLYDLRMSLPEEVDEIGNKYTMLTIATDAIIKQILEHFDNIANNKMSSLTLKEVLAFISDNVNTDVTIFQAISLLNKTI